MSDDLNDPNLSAMTDEEVDAYVEARKKARAAQEARIDAELRDVETTRTNLLAAITRAYLTTPTLTDVVKLASDPPEYELVFGSVVLRLGGDQICSRVSCTRRLSLALDRGVVVNEKRWPGLLDAMLRVARHDVIDPEATDGGLGASLVEGFVATRGVMPSFEQALTGTPWGGVLPFDEDGRRYVHGPSLRKWANASRDDRIDHKRLGALLRAADWKGPKQRSTTDVDGRRVDVWLWSRRIPRENE